MQPKTLTHNRIATGLIIAVILIGVVIVASDWQKMRLVLSEASWQYIPVVLALTFLSYAFYSYGYAVVGQMMDIHMRKLELAEACFISSVVNRVLSTGGVVGYSLRYLLMNMYSVAFKDVLSSSMFHVYLTSLDMATFLPITFLYLLANATVPRAIAISLGVMTGLFTLALILITSIFIFPSLRQPFIKLLTILGKRILRRDYQPWLTQFDDSLSLGACAVRQRPILLIWILLLTLADFVCSIAAMGFTFTALGTTVTPGVLVTGYVIGVMAGVLSMIPGGVVIQEASMAGVYALLGVPFAQAVLAAILFRILFYFVPYFLILPFYNRLLVKAKQQATGDS
jgi:uncharacterized protein (TIRG00374 family)